MAKSKLPSVPKTTRSKGRPSVYTEALGAKIGALISEGITLTEIAERPDMPARGTMNLWAVDHPHFSLIYQRARAAAAHSFHDRIVKLTNDAAAGTIDPSAARESMRGLMWVTERANARAYGAKQELAHTSPDGSMSGGPVTVVINGVDPKPKG